MHGWRAEPVAVAAAIRSLILVGVAFGLRVTDHQLAAVMLAVELVLALVLRSQVTTEDTMRAAGTSGPDVARIAGDPQAILVEKRVRSQP